jgi:ribosomal protein L7/L12
MSKQRKHIVSICSPRWALMVGLVLCMPGIANAVNPSVLFKAYVESPIAAQPGVKIPFSSTDTEYNIGAGWDNATRKFSAPVTGYYHFDVGINLTTNDINKTCRFQVNLHNFRGHHRTYPLFVLRIFGTDVADRPNEHINRPSGQMLTGNGGLDLYMRAGDEVYVQLTGSAALCYSNVTLNGKAAGDATYFSYLSGHLIAAADSIAVSDAPTQPDTGNTDQDKAAGYDVQLVSVGTNKLATIKLLRRLTKVTLKDAKAMVSKLPSTAASGKSLKEANDIAVALQKAGVLTRIAETR